MSAALPGAPVLAAPAHDHAAPHGHPAPTLSSTPAEPAAEIAHPSSRSSHSGETLTDCDAVDLEKADKKSADGKEAGGASDESQSGGASKGPSSPKEEEESVLRICLPPDDPDLSL